MVVCVVVISFCFVLCCELILSRFLLALSSRLEQNNSTPYEGTEHRVGVRAYMNQLGELHQDCIGVV